MKTRTVCLLSWASLVSHSASGFSSNTQNPQTILETACGPTDWTTTFDREAARPFCDQSQCLAALRIAASSRPSGGDDRRPVYATAYESIVHVCADSTHLHRTLASSQVGNAGGVPQTPMPAPSSPPSTAPSPTPTTSAPPVTTAPTMQPPRAQLPPSGTASSPPPTTSGPPPTTAPTTQPPRTQLPQPTAPVMRSPLPSSGACTKEDTSKIPSYPEYKRAVGACGPGDGTPGSIGISGAAYCSNSECVLAFKAYVAVLPTCTIDGRSVQAAYQEIVDLCRGVIPVVTQPRTTQPTSTTAPATTLPLPGGPPRTGSCTSDEILRMSSLPLLQGVVNACGPGNWGSGIISGTAFCTKSECVRALEAYTAELPTCILDTATGLSVRAAFLAAIDVCQGVPNVPMATTLKPVDATAPSAPSPPTTAVVPPDSPISPSTTAVPPPVLGAPVPATTSPAASSTTSGSVAGANSAATVDNTTNTSAAGDATAIERNPDKVGVFPTPAPSTANVAPTPVQSSAPVLVPTVCTTVLALASLHLIC